MTDPDQFPEALDGALRLLAQTPRSEHQIRTALTAKRFDESTVEQVVQRLAGRGLLDDRALARSRAQKRLEEGIGVERIREELRRLGIEPETIDDAVQERIADASKWVETTLRRRIEKRPGTTRAAAYRFLASRGFTEEEIEQAVESAFGAEDRFAE